MTDIIPTQLPSRLFHAQQVREMDFYAIHQLGIPGIELMNRAGVAAFAALKQRWPSARTLSLLCGGGNNAGDAYVMGRLARAAGLDVRAYPLISPDKLKGDARTAFEAYQAEGGPILDFVPANFDGAEVLVDGILGTGLDREVEGLFKAVIEGVNRYSGGVLALDLPSGLNADSGKIMGVAVKAELTVSFIGLKQGLFTGDGLECCGVVVFDNLATPPTVQASQTPSARLLPRWAKNLPKRNKNAHKGRYGHVLVVGGQPGFSGAARLAGEAATRVGAGLVSIATHPAHAISLNLGRPELMVHGVSTASDLQGLLKQASVVAVGPGLGQSDWGTGLYQAVLASGLPLVVDADALNLLAAQPTQNENWIITPHPGEAGRLLNTSSGVIQNDRFEAVKALQKRYGGAVVLKGAGSLVQGTSTLPAVCIEGNPGMATGGMGDVLTGVIAGLLAQGYGLTEAAELGVSLHAAAADWAAQDGERGLLASDLFPLLRKLVN